MDSSLLFLGLLVVFSHCQGNSIGRSSNSFAESESLSNANGCNGGGSSSGYPVDTGPIGQCVIAASESQSSSSGFSGNSGAAGGSFSGSQSQSGAGSFVDNNAGQSEFGSSGEHRLLESQGKSFGQALGSAIIETASQVQSAVNSGIAQLGSNIQNNVQNIVSTVANGIASNLESLHAAQAATAANIQNNAQNIANTVANGISSNLETLHAAQAATAANIQNNALNIANTVAAANIENNVHNIANAVASGISSNLESLNAAQAATADNIHNLANTVANGVSSNLESLHAVQAATSANIENNVHNIANAVANGISSNLESLNAAQAATVDNIHNLANTVAGSVSSHLDAAQGALQTAASGLGQAAIDQAANDRVAQPSVDTVGSQVGNVDQVNGNGGGFSAFSSGGSSGTFHVNTVSSVTQNGQTVIKHEEFVDRLGEHPQSTSGTVVLDNHGQVIASEVHPGGSGNFAPRPETLPLINTGLAQGSALNGQTGSFVEHPQATSGTILLENNGPQPPNYGFAQGSFQSNSVSTSTQNGQTVVTQERVTDRFGDQPHSSSETVVFDRNGNVLASSGPTNIAANGFGSANAVPATDPIVNGGEVSHVQASNFAGVNDQPAVVPVSQSTGNSFFDNLSSSFGSGGVVGTFHSSSVSSSSNQNGQTVVNHQETSERFGEPQHFSSETVVVNNGVVSGVSCVDNHCVTQGN